MRDVAALRPHPEVLGLHRWEPGSEQFAALARDIEQRGIDVPLFVTASGLIMDGVTRWRCAQAAGLHQVPCQVRPERDVVTIALKSIAGRRHYSKGAMAYIAIPLSDYSEKAAEKRKKGNLWKGNQVPNPIESDSGFSTSYAQIAYELGISTDTVEQAAQVIRHFQESDQELADWIADRKAKQPTFDPEKDGFEDPARPIDLRAKYERSLLDGDMGLGSVLKGIAMDLSDPEFHRQSLGRRNDYALQVANHIAKIGANCAKCWKSAPESMRRATIKAAQKAVLEHCPDELRDALRDTLNDEYKARRAGQKGATV
jgi:hypothetical protein